MFLIKEFQHLEIKMEDVLSATDNFASNKLIGRGGFGLVYRGELSLPEGRTLVAFKRLDRNLGQGNTEFWKEIMMLSKYKHENLISLIHFCILGDERILVYDYASRGSLDRYLSDANLTWIQRLNICLGVARALRYLHDPMATQQRLLHRDIKSSNILLDDKWNAKVSDFGLSKIGLANLPHTYQVSNAVGTPGYCDPLYYETGLVSKESDVYSFGVVLFEVLCGKLCCEYRNDKLVCILVPTWKKCFAEKRMDDIIYGDLKDQINQDSLMTFSTIANQCLDRDHKKRPTMIQIVKKLEIALAQCGAIKTNGVLKRRKSSVLPAQSLLDHKMSALHKYVTTKLMSLKRRRFEGEESTDDHEPQRKITSTRAGVSALVRGAKVMIIQTLQRFMAPIIVPIFTPMIQRVITEQIGSAKQDILASMKENLTNKGSTPVPNKLRLKFRNKISQPVFFGEPLLGENGTVIQIDLVNSLNEQIVNTGPASIAKLEVVGFRLGDNEKNDDSWTFEDFQKQIMIKKNGKRTLQGITSLQLKEGTCFVDNCSFTRYLENTKEGWYRLGVGVVDAALVNVVDIATTEAFQMKDGHALYSEEHPHPCLSDKVCHLRHIPYEGTCYKLLEEAGVITVKDLLILLYTNPKRLEDILQLKASSKIWDDVVKTAHASNGMFLYLDPSNKQKPGVVLNAKLQLKALIVEAHQYIPVNQLSAEQKVDNQDLVKFASKNLEMLLSFEDETCLIEYLQSLPSANQSARTPNIIDVKIIGWDAMIRIQCSKKYHPAARLMTALIELDLEVHQASVSVVNDLMMQQATVKMGSRFYTQDQLRLALTNRISDPR